MGCMPQTFKRKEVKYLINDEQKQHLLATIAQHLEQDQFGHATISNIYFDDPNSRLIRRSIEKPTYKEKLRVRGYNTITPESQVFIELKKKYKGIVYKRRLNMSVPDSSAFLQRKVTPQGQIEKEVRYFLDFYQTLAPAMFLSYERDAYFCTADPSLRITFDSDIIYRCDHMQLAHPKQGTALLDEQTFIMEIKCADAMPLWLVQALSANKIYTTSFSKYGTAYMRELEKDKKGRVKIA